MFDNSRMEHWERVELAQHALQKMKKLCKKVARLHSPEVMPDEYYERIYSRKKLFRFLEATADIYPKEPKSPEERRKWAISVMREYKLRIPRDI
jgi:hypothetical protein